MTLIRIRVVHVLPMNLVYTESTYSSLLSLFSMSRRISKQQNISSAKRSQPEPWNASLGSSPPERLWINT